MDKSNRETFYMSLHATGFILIVAAVAVSFVNLTASIYLVVLAIYFQNAAKDFKE